MLYSDVMKICTLPKKPRYFLVFLAFIRFMPGFSAIPNPLPVSAGDEERARSFFYKGEELMNERLYEDALSWYNRAITAANQTAGRDLPLLPIVMGMAADYYMLGDYQQALNILESAEKTLPSLEKISPCSSLAYLKSLCCKRLGFFDKGIELLQTGLIGEKGDPDWFFVQKGICLYELGEFAKAKECFEKALLEKNKIPARISVLYLARIVRRSKDYLSAGKILNDSVSCFKESEPLYVDYLLIKAKNMLSLHKNLEACDLLSEALQKRNSLSQRAMTSGVQIFFKALSAAFHEKNISDELLKKCAENGKKLFFGRYTKHPNELNTLMLLKFNSLKYEKFPDGQDEKESELLFQKIKEFQNPALEFEALFFRIRSLHDSFKKEKLFDRLTDERYIQSPYYVNAWILRAFNEFNIACKEPAGEKKDRYLKRALAFCLKVLDLSSDFSLCKPALKLYLRIGIAGNQSDYLKEGLHRAEKAAANAKSPEERGAYLYIGAVFASHMEKFEGNGIYIERAKDFLHELI